MPADQLPRRRRERGSITAEEILTGAFEVAAEVSVQNVSMPVLAKHLGVGVTSIYWYFRRKDDLLDAMTERLLERHDGWIPAIDAVNWRTSLRDHAIEMRRRFLADPVVCDLILIRGIYANTAARQTIRRMEQPVTALIAAGLDAEDAFYIYSSISLHVRGSVVLERLQGKLTEPTGDFVGLGTPRPRIGIAGRTNFEFTLDCILEQAGALLR